MSSVAWQCSSCFTNYTNEEFQYLPESQTCVKCGKRFLKEDSWHRLTQIKTLEGNNCWYTVSTVHFEFVLESQLPFWYETMVWTEERLLAYQVRYETQQEAIQGHDRAVSNIDAIAKATPDRDVYSNALEIIAELATKHKGLE